MRQKRIKVLKQCAVYHCITRVVGGLFLLDEEEAKEVLRKQIHQVAKFCGVEVLTFCVMSNHFHVLLRVPEPERLKSLSDTELLRRCEALYGEDEISMLQWENRLSNPEKREHWRGLLIARMGDVSSYMKELKQRFTIWYNKTHDRYGTLWAERFKSVLVENKLGALMMVAAYIDLNPVRAAMVEDPKDYRWCGYAESLAVGIFSKSGLGKVFARSNYSKEKALDEYRKLLFGVGYKGKYSGGPVIEQQMTREVMDQNGKLSKSDLLRHRVRYFSDGCVLGSKEFVKGIYREYKQEFTDRKTDNTAKVPISDDDSFVVFRNLRKDVIG